MKYYERVEFLGDAVLELVVSEYLYKRYKDMPQGKLTRLRAAMVCEKVLQALPVNVTFLSTSG